MLEGDAKPDMSDIIQLVDVAGRDGPLGIGGTDGGSLDTISGKWHYSIRMASVLAPRNHGRRDFQRTGTMLFVYHSAVPSN